MRPAAVSAAAVAGSSVGHRQARGATAAASLRELGLLVGARIHGVGLQGAGAARAIAQHQKLPTTCCGQQRVYGAMEACHSVICTACTRSRECVGGGGARSSVLEHVCHRRLRASVAACGIAAVVRTVFETLKGGQSSTARCVGGTELSDSRAVIAT
jgi:hypothetical protein